MVHIVKTTPPPSAPSRSGRAVREVRMTTYVSYDPLRTVVDAKEAWKNDLRNLQWLCNHCNTQKGDRSFAEWIGKVTKKLPAGHRPPLPNPKPIAV